MHLDQSMSHFRSCVTPFTFLLRVAHVFVCSLQNEQKLKNKTLKKGWREQEPEGDSGAPTGPGEGSAQRGGPRPRFRSTYSSSYL